MREKKYLMNGFRFLFNSFEKHIPDYAFKFLFPKPGRFDFITNYLLFRKWQKQGKIKEFDVVHVNNWENFLNIPSKKKRGNQIWIAESHGFHVGLNFEQTIKELPLPNKIMSKILKSLLTKKIKKKIKEFDIYYVSTPNMLEHAKKIRQDAMWLPNPINMDVFNPYGKKIKLQGNPAIFLPTRLHVFKNPIFAINLFKKIKKKYPKACLHLIDYGFQGGPLTPELKMRLKDKEIYIWHKRMDKERLATMYRSADLILGQFNETLGMLSLVELEAMDCGAPMVTLDLYELNLPLDQCEKKVFKILENNKFKKQYVNRLYNYVVRTHSAESIKKVIISNIQKIKENQH